MLKTSDEYKNLTIKVFTKAEQVYEKNNAGIYKICRKDYPEIEKFYHCVYRCLRPGGRLILRDFTSDSSIVRWLATHLEMPLAHASGHGDVDMLHRDEVQRGLEEAGMKIEKNEIRKGGRLHLVARKPEQETEQ